MLWIWHPRGVEIEKNKFMKWEFKEYVGCKIEKEKENWNFHNQYYYTALEMNLIHQIWRLSLLHRVVNYCQKYNQGMHLIQVKKEHSDFE